MPELKKSPENAIEQSEGAGPSPCPALHRRQRRAVGRGGAADARREGGLRDTKPPAGDASLRIGITGPIRRQSDRRLASYGTSEARTEAESEEPFHEFEADPVEIVRCRLSVSTARRHEPSRCGGKPLRM